MAAGGRVGILGGTFDPPHCGHVAAAVAARHTLALDRVLFVVANEPWQKVPHRAVTAAVDRLAMVEAAVSEDAGLEACAIEIERGGPSYTVDTVEALRDDALAHGREVPDLYLVVGADLVPGLPTWRRVDDLRKMVTLAIVSRPGSRHVDAPGWRVVHVDGEAVDVSSSEVRERLERGEPVDGLVPPAVVRCIERRGLYAVTR